MIADRVHALLADRGNDADAIRAEIGIAGTLAVIPARFRDWSEANVFLLVEARPNKPDMEYATFDPAITSRRDIALIRSASCLFLDGIAFAVRSPTRFMTAAVPSPISMIEVPRSSSGAHRRRDLYKWRHLTEKFCKFREFNRVAMRVCKTDRSFGAMTHLSAAVTNS